MTKDEFKKLCKDEFGVKRYSVTEEFKLMEDLFGVPARTYQNWIAKDNVRPWFLKMLEMYRENGKLKEEGKRLTQENKQLEKNLLAFNERLSKLKPNS